MQNLKKMLNNNLLKNKRAQVGETLTWIVATIIIIFILLIFIYASVALGKAKAINPKKVKFKDLGEDGKKEITWIEAKTILAKQINSQNENSIDNWINQNQIEQNENS